MRGQILSTIHPLLAALGYPIIYTDIGGTPPGSGVWLELTVFENEGLQPGISYSASHAAQGLIQIEVYGRQKSPAPGDPLGAGPIDEAADEVITAIPAGTTLTTDGRIRVHRRGTKSSPQVDGDRMVIPVTFRYSA